MSEKKFSNTAILLAAGRGTRMGGDCPKQYRKICGKPLIAWTLEALGKSPVIDDIVMVIPEGDEEYIRLDVFPFVTEGSAGKVRKLAAGGAERYDSVYSGLRAIDWDCDYVYIHDGARPFIDEKSLERLQEAVTDRTKGDGACVAGMPSKDTVKIADADHFVTDTPDRTHVWTIQTPQVFDRNLITEAYSRMMRQLPELSARGIHITDDAMAAELMMNVRVQLVEASYRNIKITTPEDMVIAEAFLNDENADKQ